VIGSSIRAAATKLLASVQTPFIVVDCDRIRRRAEEVAKTWYRSSSSAVLAYSYKTNSLPCVTSAILAAGYWAEAVSMDEVRMAISDGCDSTRVLLNGPCKTREDLIAAVHTGVLVQVDSVSEIRRICSIPCIADLRPRVALRLSVLRDGRWSRFGLSPDEYFAAVYECEAAGVPIVGLHFHCGSNLTSARLHAGVLRMFAPILEDLSNRFTPGELVVNIGGGFALTSAKNDDPLRAHEAAARCVVRVMRDLRLNTNATLRVAVEPGRSLVEDCAAVVTSVVDTKVRGSENLILVDVGTNVIRSGQERQHPVEPLIPAASAASAVIYRLYGPNCFEMDTLGVVESVSGVGPGDVLLVGGVRAYDMATSFAWSRPLPSIWGIVGGQVTHVARRFCEDPRDASREKTQGAG